MATTPDGGLGRSVLFGTVFITGAVIMILELLGTRIIGPFYGSSLYVWSSLITVTLIALAIGYGLGGWLSVHAPRFGVAHVVVSAGLLIAAIPLLSPPVLAATNSLGLRAGALCSSLLLFLPPLTLLGMTGPLVIQGSARQLSAVGLTSGVVYAISTVGSVLGTAVFGFYLLPAMGSRMTLVSLSATLLLLGVVLHWLGRGRGVRAAAVLPLAGLGLALLLAPRVFAAGGSSGATFLFDSESLYGRVRVFDDEQGVRWMLSDASTISAAKVDTMQPIFPYLHLLEALPSVRPGSERALLIGLGGGFIPHMFGEQGLVTDCIEIDPAVVAAASEQFGFEPTGQLVVGDGRYEISKLAGGYDLVVHDCFTGGSVPSHLLSREMLSELKALMTPGGLFSLNYFGITFGPGAEAASAIKKTLAAVFGQVEVLVAEPRQPLCDIVFLASDEPIALDSVPAHAGLPRGWLEFFRLKLPAGQGFVISDDFNPLEQLQVEKSEAYRELLVERVGLDLLTQ